MHPIIAKEVVRTQIADWHRQAERDRLTREARSAPRQHDRHFAPGHLATVFTRRVRPVLAARTLW